MATIIGNAISVSINNKIVLSKNEDEDAGNAMYIEALEDNGVFKIVQYGVDNRNKSIKYMKNSPGIWQNYTMNQEITLNQGDKIYLMSEDTISMAVEGYSGKTNLRKTVTKNIDCSIKYKVGGNAQSLLNYSSIVSAHAFEYLFFGLQNLIEISEELLPAITLTDACYASMFSNCSGLTTLPENLLPATTLTSKCYYGIFSGCSGLTTAPKLPATTLADSCYSLMFKSCTSLVNAPALPATTLASSCYYRMFNGCTSLVNAPELPATSCEGRCYYLMFFNCTSLVNAPALPATTLIDSCYSYMFYGCSSLFNAPALPATTLAINCYNSMFSGCRALVNAPALPATTLIYGCYSYMFEGCTSLVNAPALPATTLVTKCYDFMFSGCSNLKEIYCNVRYDIDGTTELKTFICSNWLYNVPNTTDCKFHKNPEWVVPTTRDNNTIPSNWLIVNWTQDTM